MLIRHPEFNLTHHTTFGLQVECGCLIEYDNVNDLKELFASGLSTRILPIGGGSNLLFTSSRFDGTVLHNRSSQIEAFGEDGEYFYYRVASGAVLDSVCRAMAESGIWGMENLSGIPGEIGGATVQNAGAYGSEMRDIIREVHCFDMATGHTKVFSVDECRFGYRDSVFKHAPSNSLLVITDVIIRLPKKGEPNLRYAALKSAFEGKSYCEITPLQIRSAVLNLRDSKLPDPNKVGSAGSFFKNPVVDDETYQRICSKIGKAPAASRVPDGRMKLSAAWLIDNAGCKPFTVGGAAVWKDMPLVLVNASGTATGSDVIRLAAMIVERVDEVFGIKLQPEVVEL